ncbi:MAG TPA: LptF/LptG family permease [Pyrinomonadaceae bacterium]|jgi:LPS export ABC transporter permease LptG/LPS export ABC transporter permease LptF
MISSRRLIERYVLGALLPYLLLALLLLTATLLGQQAGRFGELLMGGGVPLPLVWEITAALLPGVLSFSLPMAMLAGTMIGFSRMGSDSELVAMRAAGSGTWRLLWPVLLLGALLSGATLFINFELMPQGARTLRRAGLRAVLYKLDSPIEPRSFNAEIPGYVVYVRDGDKTRGRWGRVFIYSRDQEGAAHLITARSGRIDSAAEQSELVLSDAVATRLPAAAALGGREYVTERLAQLRIVFNTGRKAVLDKLRSDEAEPDELGWRELSDYAAKTHGAEGRDAATLLQKRLTMSAAPLVFALLGVALGLRVRKGGRGMGVLLSLLTLIAYYLISLLGEQLARAGTVPVAQGTWLATTVTVAFSLALLLIRERGFGSLRFMRGGGANARATAKAVTGRRFERGRQARLLGFPSLLDMSLLRMLTLSFLYSYAALVSIFLIFTLFELWRFIAATGAGARLVARYMLFLLPLLSVELLPASVLLAMLVTYALMSRRSEAVAWWACGQSVYRLVLPGLLFACAVGACAWLIQERLMPQANLRQDALRAQIRGGVSRVTTPVGRQWLAAAGNGRLYAYEYEEGGATLKDLAIYDFDDEGVHLRQVIQAREGVRTAAAGQMELHGAESLIFKGAGTERAQAQSMTVGGIEPEEVFRPGTDKPAYLNAKQLSAYIKSIKQRGGTAVSLAAALERKYTEPLSALVMALIGIPTALSFGRRSAIIALVSALGIGLGFRAVTGGCTQLAVYGLLPAAVAAWAPPIIFASAGIYLLFRART